MRQLIFITLMLCTISITSCKKESSGDHPNEEVMLRINNWLDSQKPVNKPYKTEYIDLLKENIEPVNIRIENLGNGEKFLIVPVKEKFKTLKKLEMNSVINLLLVIDEAGKIRRGNVCQYFPKQQGSAQTIPVNTFYKLYNNKELDCDGSFRFLSVTGRRLYQYDYESGKLKSMGIVKPKTNSADNAAGRINTCWEWYYVTTYFNSDGEIIDETWQYLGTTCDGDDCQDQNNAMLCPDSETGSGGGTGDSGEACCVNDPNIQFTSEQ
ncbi:MAG TPA: hypothetical protein VFP97_02525, partial [Chitinophagaceae bacterium]|nr:hypothetical protein [Chitinophagaceae bacterium]